MGTQSTWGNKPNVPAYVAIDATLRECTVS